MKSIQKQLNKKLNDLNVMGILKKMMYSRSYKEFSEAFVQMEDIDDAAFQNYMNKTMYKFLDRFCETQTPSFFHGLTITTSPLEKINDLIKTDIPYHTKPNFIIAKVEALTQRMTKYDIKSEKTKLTKVHRDLELLKVQESVSAKIFEVFYSNYVQAS